MSVPTFETLALTLFPSGVLEIAFNRPRVYNALNAQVYKDWLDALRWAKADDKVSVVVLTGRGKYYSSGAELAIPDLSPEGQERTARHRGITKDVVSELVCFPKVLISAVNGPAYGFAVTTLALCDVVYCVPHATFATPFMKLGFCAEGCSSALFPRIMGPSRANEILLMGRTFSADEMVACGMVSRTLPADGFRDQVLALAEETAKFSLEALKTTKDLVRRVDRDFLLQVNEEEIKRLGERKSSEYSIQAMRNFVAEAERKRAAKKQKKSKL